MLKRDGEAGKAEANSVPWQLRGEARWRRPVGLFSASLSSPLLQAVAVGGYFSLLLPGWFSDDAKVEEYCVLV
nr:hypothetical protein Itr_chr12CG07930 [Ipomoea trifida]